MSEETSRSLSIGSVFADRFEVVRLLGEGAFGSVFEARMRPLMRRVALKILHADIAMNPQFAQRFLREARILGELEHPHVVSVVDVGLHGSTLFLVMEYLDGETLAARLRSGGAMSVRDAIAVILPLCSALHAVHRQGVVHRDLKPDNVMLARQATGHITPKVLDFGIAKANTVDQAHTRTASVMGTPFYMSPEQATDSKNIDARSDQWSLAVMLWEMLTGARLFDGPHHVAILSAVISGAIPPLRTRVPDAPEALELAIARALEREPSCRFESVELFARALLACADEATRARWSEAFGAPATDRVTGVPPRVAASAEQPPGGQRGEPIGATVVGAPASATHPTSAASSLQGGSVPPIEGSVSFATLPPRTQSIVQGPPAPRPRRALWIGVGASALAAVAATVVVLNSGGSTPPRVHTLPTPSAFTVALRTEPVSARIDLDGRFVSAGVLLRELPRDHRPHAIRVYADGYITRTVTFADASPGDLVTLERLAEPAARPASQPAARAPEASRSARPAPRASGATTRRAVIDPGAYPMPQQPTQPAACPNGECVF
jgi:serine/threonine protein kinase